MKKHILRFILVSVFSIGLISLEESFISFELRVVIVILSYGILLYQMLKTASKKDS